jgi:hypothetical protein
MQQKVARIPKDILGSVFQVLFNQVTGSPAIGMTRHKLELEVPLIPKITILGCLKYYEGGKFIECTKNDIVITPKDLNTDYDEFRLTYLGAQTEGFLFGKK